jgi:hypothetical protein
MKTRTLLAVLALAILSACGGTPTGTRAPERAALDETPPPPDTSSTVVGGGSYGSGR